MLKDTTYGEGVEAALSDLNSNVCRNPVFEITAMGKHWYLVEAIRARKSWLGVPAFVLRTHMQGGSRGEIGRQRTVSWVFGVDACEPTKVTKTFASVPAPLTSPVITSII